MQYFKPSDVCTINCTVQNIARSGAVFAMDQNEDSVYIPLSIAQRASIDIGDAITCYCIDQSLDENKRHEVTARYRAIRLKVDQRLAEVVSGLEASEIMADRSSATPEPVKPREFTLDEARTIIGECFKKRRAWTAEQLIEEVCDFDKQSVMTEEMKARIISWLSRLHNDGIVANCKIREQGGREPIQYFAATVDILIQLVDDFELDAE